MNVSTFMKRTALVAVLAVGTVAASAQTFVYDGVIYKNSKGNLTVQKAGTKVTVGEAGPATYAGDIKIPYNITYGGTDYVVTSVAAAFKGSTELTSITIAPGVTTISRGGFSGCTALKTAVLPSDLVTFNGDIFSGCTALEEIEIPGTLKEISSTQFKGCVSLRKIVFAAGDTPIEVLSTAFSDGGMDAVEEVVLNRELGTKYSAMDQKPFRGAKALKTLTIGGTCKNLPASSFENASQLQTVVFENEPASFGTNLFAGTAIKEISIPSSITSLPGSFMQNCRSLVKVTLPEGLATIGDMAFYNSTVSEVNFPSTLTSIGQMAFSGANVKGDVVFPATLKTIGVQAFANNSGITSVALPAALKTFGDGAFKGATGIAKYTVDAANETFKSDAQSVAVESIDGSTLYAFAPASSVTSIAGGYTSVAPYAAFAAKNVTEVNLPSCTSWGDYSFSGTGIAALTVRGTVGRYVSSDCPALKELSIEGSEVPLGIGYNNTALADVKFLSDITTVKQHAFAGCTALQALDLGKTLAIIEADAFAGSAVKNLTVGAPNPAGLAPGVFTESSDITVKVPVDYVDVYKAAGGWSYLTIVGDANVEAGPSDMGMPDGLYYAGEDGVLHAAYADGNSDSYDVGGVPHTFQLAQFKNRIYGASAGKKFVYSATSAVDGDGKLFYISQIGANTFQAVVLDNAGGNAYKDPFGLYIYGDHLFVNDRNVCVRKISADALSLPINYESWMENNWMGFYNSEWSYGCIKSGWAITQSANAAGEPEPEYWVGMKYNGNGIYRFKDEHVGSASTPGVKPENGVFLNACTPIFTTFFIDEAHKHMYIYLEISGSKADAASLGGVYRISLDDLEANPNPSNFSALNPVLIDGSPVKYEGSATNEHVGITQFSPDEKGEYLYWCYRAPTEAEAAANEAVTDFDEMKSGGKYWWADKYDASNPLHQSGIKRIKLGVDKPEVEMVVPGVSGYGVIPVNFESSKKPDAVQNIVAPATEAPVVIAQGVITATEEAVVYVYDMAGTVVAYGTLAAGKSMNVSHLTSGAYIAVANGTPAKFVK